MKDKILLLAEKLLLTQGYNAFSYSHISSALGIKNAAVHYHYPKKSDLGIAIIEKSLEDFKSWEKNSAKLPPQKMLDKFLNAYYAKYKNLNCLCLGGSLQADFHTLPDEMKVAAKNYICYIYSWLEHLLDKGQKEGIFQFSDTPRDASLTIMALLQGSLQISVVGEQNIQKRFCKIIKSMFLE